MVEEAVGEVIGGAVEVAADVLRDIGSLADDGRRRRRRGCWRLFLIVLVVALVVWGVAALSG
jgi:hypothetical protein